MTKEMKELATRHSLLFCSGVTTIGLVMQVKSALINVLVLTFFVLVLRKPLDKAIFLSWWLTWPTVFVLFSFFGVRL